MINSYNRLLDLIANNRNDEETAIQRNPTNKSHYYSAEPELADKDRRDERDKLAKVLKSTPKGKERKAKRGEVASSHPLGTLPKTKPWGGWSPKESVGDEMRRKASTQYDKVAKRNAALAFVARTKRRQADEEAAELDGNTLRDKGRANAAGKVK
jgi:hypothetical protein